jgi:hypothetical protein
MRQFLRGSDTAFADLEQRARRACVIFRDQEMPPGAQPPRARVGFEVDPRDGSALLLVDRGVHYAGPYEEVREWLTNGSLRFPDFAALRHWLREVLALAYGPWETSPTPQTPPPQPVFHSPEELTNLEEVQAQAVPLDRPLYLDEEALFHELARQVRGQDQALRLLARRVCRHLARRHPRRPATFFAIGPTGVGKTRTAEVLPQALRTLISSGQRYSYLRLDMPEYQERHRVSQLLGAPQGYIGYGEGAQLIDALVANPRTVVLFDEIEKAHPNILRTLMNAMDAGRLSTPASTAQGREIDCRYAIFFFTSNLDATAILRDLEVQNAFENEAVVDRVCRGHLQAAGIAPELVGRIGYFLVFRPLTPKARTEIMTLAVARVAAEYGLEVVYIEPQVIGELLERARTGDFGARPDEYLADEVLGACFARTAAAGLQGPVVVRGKGTYWCEPATPATTSSIGMGTGP